MYDSNEVIIGNPVSPSKRIESEEKDGACINDVMKITDWHWLNSRVVYSQLLERLIRHGVKKDEALDILSVAYHTAIDHSTHIR